MIRIFIFAISLLLLSGTFAAAQLPASDQKKKLIAELVTVMKMDSQFPEMMDAMLKELEKTFPIGFESAIDANTSLSVEEKSDLKKTSTQKFVAFSKKFRKRLPEVVNYDKYINDAVYPLFDKFYSEQELLDLIAFYKTPTGKKLIETLPALMAESNNIAREKFLPQILPIIEQIVKEEFDQIGAPPKPKDN